MQIDMQNPAMLAAITARLTKELGDTYAANCALDIIGDALAAERDALRAQVVALVERTTNDQALITDLRRQVDSMRDRGKGSKAQKE